MNGCISVINSGSSSIKFSLFSRTQEDTLECIFNGQIEGIGVVPHFKVKDPQGKTLGEERWANSKALDHETAITFIITWIRKQREELNLQLIGVGHRVVHGGEAYQAPVLINDQILTELERYIPLAPLHQPHNLGSIRTIMNLGSDIPQVACFDTAFHHTNSSLALGFAIPRYLSEEGVRRYGFHGLSYEYISREIQKKKPELVKGRIVIAHLGSGASMCGLFEGKSVTSTMGFSAMEGLMMGTRPGTLDPGVLLYLMQEKGMTAQHISNLLYRDCGLLGVSGISNDMRVLLDSESPHAAEAINLFVYRIHRELGSICAALGGIDLLIFTAGIGEHSAEIREMVCKGAAWLGLKLDQEANRKGKMLISTTDSPVQAMVIPTNEEFMIATHVKEILCSEQSAVTD